jgi:hypothetical protein
MIQRKLSEIKEGNELIFRVFQNEKNSIIRKDYIIDNIIDSKTKNRTYVILSEKELDFNEKEKVRKLISNEG